jgi:hypothetical protein
MSAYIIEGKANVTALELKVHTELKDLLPALSDEQRSELSDSINTSGIYAPVIGWNDGKVWWLADGNNRREILVELKADSLEEVKAWVIKEHIGRRNLTPNQISELRGSVFNQSKETHGGDRKTPEKQEEKSKRQNVALKTSEAIAETFGVSPRTIERDGNFAKGMQVVEKENPEVAKAIRSGKSPVKKKDVEAIGRGEEPEKPKSNGKPADPAQKVKELCKPFTGLVSKIGEVIAEFERMGDKPGGEFIDSIAIQEMTTKGRNLQEVVKARRPTVHKVCAGKGCKSCNNLGYVKG